MKAPSWMVVTDAGRAAVYKGEVRDCTVRAFAIAFEIDYATAHAFFSANGRKLQRKFKEKPLMAATTAKPVHMQGITVERFLKIHTHGRFYCQMRGHCFAVIDGKVYDLPGDVKERSVIKTAWQVS